MKILRNILFAFLIFSISLNSFAEGEAEKNTPKEIKILSWNIFMLPGPFIKTNQKERAHHIAEKLIENDADIIVLQESFHKRARRIIKNKLKEIYPHNSGKQRKKHFIKYTNSGVLILSKHPLEKIKTKFYSKCKTSDCMASKAGVLVEVNVEGDKIQIVGTHLQAWDEEEKQIVREYQCKEISENLLLPHQKKGIAQFIVGDMNIDKKNNNRHKKMLDILDAEDGEIQAELNATCGTNKNFFYKNSNKEEGKILDYILFRKNESNTDVKKRFVRIFKADWKKNGENLDLSDHYAVEAVIEIK